MTSTALDRWYQIGHLTRAQYEALVQWREDGGGIRRRSRKAPQSTTQPHERDLMAEAARTRHREACRAVEGLGAHVARAVHRLVMADNEAQRVDRVARGASLIWACYASPCALSTKHTYKLGS